MGKNTIRKFLCIPFVTIALPFLAIGLSIRFGLEVAVDILEKFTQIIKDNHEI